MSALTERLVDLLEKNRLRAEQMREKVKDNPLFTRPGFVWPDLYAAGATEEDLTAFTSRTEIELPDDVKQWLRITNGPSAFYGIGSAQKGANMEELWELLPDLRQPGWIPVGTDDVGNIYVRVVSESGGRGGVFYVHATSPDELAYAAASDTLHFAVFSLEESLHVTPEFSSVEEAYKSGKMYGWPRDKSFVLSKDPELAHVEGAPLFWDS